MNPLLQAIYDAPEDDSARLVYADWLQEQGDPRGELIAVQIAGTEKSTPAVQKRMAELLETHGKEWQGRLWEVTTWAEFERGFLARCGLNAVPAWAIGLPEWSTVEHIGFSTYLQGDMVALLSNPVMKSLRSLRMSSHVLSFLLVAKIPPLRVRTIELIGSLNDWRPIADSPTLASVTAVIADETHRSIGRDLVEPYLSRFERIAFQISDWDVVIVRGPGGKLSSFRAKAKTPWKKPGVYPSGPDPHVATIVELLDQIPPEVLTEIMIEQGLAVPSPDLRRSLNRHLRVKDPRVSLR